MMMPIKHAARFLNGAAFKPSDWGSVGLPILRIAQLTGKPFDNYFDGAINRGLVIRDGDLLFSWSATIDAFIWGRGDAILNQHIFKVLPKNNSLTQYLYYVIKAHAPRWADDDAHGSTMRHIKKESLSNKVWMPDLGTQRSIANFLDIETARIDQLIEKKQRLVSLLAERFEATLANLTSPPTDEPSDWIERPIKNLCTIFGRIGFRGYTVEDIVDEGEGAITLSPSNIKDGRMLLRDKTYLSWHKYHESPEIQISSGDIVFVKTGSTIGKVAKVDDLPEAMTLNPQLVVLKNIIPDPDFLLFFMQSKPFQFQVSINCLGGSTPAMSQGSLGRLRVWLPNSKEEQSRRANAIIEERQKIDEMKELLASTISRLYEFRFALITAAVTGQIDVTTWRKQGQTDRRLDRIEEAMSA